MRQEPNRDLLRESLLGNLRTDTAAHVEALLRESESWRVLLTEVENEVALLDGLHDTVPPTDLADQTLARIRRAERARRKHSASWAWRQAVATAAVVAALATIFFMLVQPLIAPTRGARMNTLKNYGLALKMYSSESRGGYYPAGIGWEPAGIEQLGITQGTAAEPQPQRSDSLTRGEAGELASGGSQTKSAPNHVYLGGALIRTPEEAQRLAQVLAKSQGNVGPDELRKGNLEPVREAIERFFITDLARDESVVAQSEVPVMIDTYDLVGSDQPRGCFVLYMDGHVAWHDYGSGGPLDAFIEAILPELRGEN